MHRNALFVIVAAVVLAGFTATTASSGNVPTVGDSLGILCVPNCTAAVPKAGDPFHVAHGFSGEPRADLLNPAHRFELTVDGEQMQGAIDLDLHSDPSSKRYVFNFRDGMTGTHEFVGCWYRTDSALDFCKTRTVTFVTS